MLRLSLGCFFLFAFFTVRAQNVTGRVYEDKTHVLLANINIQNLTSKQRTITDGKGRFTVEAKLNDLIVFSGFGYQPDTLVVTDFKEREIIMIPIQHMLNEVRVNASGKANSKATAIPFDRDFHNQTMQYQMDDNGNYKGGVNIRFWASKKGEHERKKEAQMIQNDKTSLEIAQVFSEENVSKFVPLKGEELKAFVIRYSPDIKTYHSPEFNLVTYINQCYKEFVKLPEAERKKTSIFN